MTDSSRGVPRQAAQPEATPVRPWVITEDQVKVTVSAGHVEVAFSLPKWPLAPALARAGRGRARVRVQAVLRGAHPLLEPGPGWHASPGSASATASSTRSRSPSPAPGRRPPARRATGAFRRGSSSSASARTTVGHRAQPFSGNPPDTPRRGPQAPEAQRAAPETGPRPYSAHELPTACPPPTG